MSKTFRLAGLVSEKLAAAKVEVDFLDLSPVTSEYGRKILAIQEETRNVGRAVAGAVAALRKGDLKAEFANLPRPRPK